MKSFQPLIFKSIRCRLRDLGFQDMKNTSYLATEKIKYQGAVICEFFILHFFKMAF